MKVRHKETELYEPVASYFAKKGYKVRSEVRGCDVTAVKDETLVIIELKLSFNLKLLMQAVERLSITDYVFVAIPRPAITDKNSVNSMFWRDMLNILRRLEIGLIVVALDSPLKTVEIVHNPMAYVTRRSKVNRLKVLKEIDNRIGDFNTGGSSRSKIITANKEKSIQIACILYEKGNASTKELRLLGITQRELLLLSGNYYNWFTRVQRGVYTLTEEGKRAVDDPDEQTVKIVNYYRYGILE